VKYPKANLAIGQKNRNRFR